MGITDDFLDGFLSPLITIIFSILVFELTKVIGILYSTTNTSFHTESVWNIWSYFLMYASISILVEIVSNVKRGYEKPLNGVITIVGVIMGTILFWGFFVNITISIISGSQNDVITSTAVVVISNLLGISCKLLLVGRDYQNRDYCYPY